MGKRRRKGAKTALCFSKKTVVYTGANAAFWSILTAVCAFNPEWDATNIGTIAGLAWAAFTTAIGFYMTKAKHENKIKLTQGMVTEWAEKYGPDFVVQIASTILTD